MSGLREERSQTYPYMLSAKQGSIWYHFCNVFGMTQSGIEPTTSRLYIANALTTEQPLRYGLSLLCCALRGATAISQTTYLLHTLSSNCKYVNCFIIYKSAQLLITQLRLSWLLVRCWLQQAGPVFIKHLKSNVYVTLNAIGSFWCNLCSHWLIQILLLKFLHEYGPRWLVSNYPGRFVTGHF